MSYGQGVPVDRARLISTPDAALAVGVSRTTLYRWWKDGCVTPAWVTPGGQARWDLAKLKEQLGKK